MRAATNFIMYQVGWFALVLGAANGFVWWGTLAGLVAIVACWLMSIERARDAQAVVITVAVGAVMESGFQLLGIFEIVAGNLWPPFVAPWLLLVWASFGLTLHESMRWLFRNRAVAAFGGGVFGPIAYAGGARAGAIRFDPSLADYALISIAWAAAFATFALVVSRRAPAAAFGTGVSMGEQTPQTDG